MESSVSSPPRNLSLAAGKNEPSLPNRSPRPRLRAIRWVREPIDAPEVYPLGAGKLGKPPVRPCGPSRLGIHCLDKARQRVGLGPLLIYKEPDVILSIVSDPAEQYIAATPPGRYFAVWLVTRHMEKAIVSFEMVGGEHKPELQLDDAASQDHSLGSSEFKPLVIVEDGALQSTAQAKSEHRPDVRLGDQAAQDASVAPGALQPELSVADKAQAAYALLEGDFRPMVFINESAEQMLTTTDGEHFLELRIQDLLEQAAQDLSFGRGAHDVPIFEVIVSDQGTLDITTDTGTYVLYYPLDNLGTYASNASVEGLNDGRFWDGSFAGRNNVTGIQVSDNVEAYDNAADVDGLNLGFWTNNSYVARATINVPIYDSMEAYADAAPVAGLDGGVGFTAGPYVDNENFARVSDDEDFESYNVQSPIVDTLNGGPRGWSGPWVFPPVYAPLLVSDEDFEAYTVQDPIVDPLNAGFGWTGNWLVGGVLVNGASWKTGGASDNFEPYADENPVVSSLNSGAYWAGAWVIGGAVTVTARDSFETYADENPVVSTLNGGTNWAGAWVTP